jgi:hypothetical protein
VLPPFFCNGSSAFRDVFQLFSKLNIVCILSFKLPFNPRNPRENSPCFYRVLIETRVFWAFDQSAPVFLKGYFIMKYMKWRITSDIISRISVIIYDWMQSCTYSSMTMPSWNKGLQNINIENGVIMQSFTRQLVI